jgi:hypothetical protein
MNCVYKIGAEPCTIDTGFVAGVNCKYCTEPCTIDRGSVVGGKCEDLGEP